MTVWIFFANFAVQFFRSIRNKYNTMAYRKIEEYDEKTTKELAAHVKAILELLGEDSGREGLLKTPERVAKAWQFLTQGYGQDGASIVQSATLASSL